MTAQETNHKETRANKVREIEIKRKQINEEEELLVEEIKASITADYHQLVQMVGQKGACNLLNELRYEQETERTKTKEHDNGEEANCNQEASETVHQRGGEGVGDHCDGGTPDLQSMGDHTVESKRVGSK